MVVCSCSHRADPRPAPGLAAASYRMLLEDGSEDITLEGAFGPNL